MYVDGEIDNLKGHEVTAKFSLDSCRDSVHKLGIDVQIAWMKHLFMDEPLPLRGLHREDPAAISYQITFNGQFLCHIWIVLIESFQIERFSDK